MQYQVFTLIVTLSHVIYMKLFTANGKILVSVRSNRKQFRISQTIDSLIVTSIR